MPRPARRDGLGLARVRVVSPLVVFVALWRPPAPRLRPSRRARQPGVPPTGRRSPYRPLTSPDVPHISPCGGIPMSPHALHGVAPQRGGAP